MPKIQYCFFGAKFNKSTYEVIDKANEIITEYEIQGFDLTLRQLYYQFVSRDIIPNKQSEYKRLGGIINDARLAGLIDWGSITDRTRNLEETTFWSSPTNIIRASASCFKLDKWQDQSVRIEVWVEKEALKGVVGTVCDTLETPYFACKGYVSQSEMWSAAMRIQRMHEIHNQKTVIIHLGDHDPSGIDMTRDIKDRIYLFLQTYVEDYVYYWEKIFEIKRIALNQDQIDLYNPPPNPAKTTDARYSSYIKNYGDESWELDALEPKELTRLIKNNILFYRDKEKWDIWLEKEEKAKETLSLLCRYYPKVDDFLNSFRKEV